MPDESASLHVGRSRLDAAFKQEPSGAGGAAPLVQPRHPSTITAVAPSMLNPLREATRKPQAASASSKAPPRAAASRPRLGARTAGRTVEPLSKVW